MVAGSTDWGVEVNLKGRRAGLVVAVDRLPELRGFSVGDTEVRLGAALTLTEVERRLGGLLPLLSALMPQFASPLIRNGATLGGNLGTGSPIGDAPPVLLALEASLVLASADGAAHGAAGGLLHRLPPVGPRPRRADRRGRRTRCRPAGSRRSTRSPSGASTTSRRWRSATRSTCATASSQKARIGLGGVAATPLRALATEAALEGQPWTEETVEAAAEVLGAEGTPISDQRASAAYRAAMLGQSLRKLLVQQEVSA